MSGLSLIKELTDKEYILSNSCYDTEHMLRQEIDALYWKISKDEYSYYITSLLEKEQQQIKDEDEHIMIVSEDMIAKVHLEHLSEQQFNY